MSARCRIVMVTCFCALLAGACDEGGDGAAPPMDSSASNTDATGSADGVVQADGAPRVPDAGPDARPGADARPTPDAGPDALPPSTDIAPDLTADTDPSVDGSDAGPPPTGEPCEVEPDFLGRRILRISSADERAAALPCAVIDGDLTISGYPGADAFSLPNLQQVTGALSAAGEGFSALNFPLLRETGGPLDVFAVDASSLSLPSLQSTGGSIRVTDSPALTSVDLSGLTHIARTDGDTLGSTFEDLPQLATLDLSALEATDGPLTLARLDTLSALSLDVLTSLDGSLTAADNLTLNALDLPLLTSAVNLIVDSNPALATLTAPKLQTLTGGLRVQLNDALTTIALPALAVTGTSPFLDGVVQVVSNASLQTLDLSALTTLGGSGLTRLALNPLLSDLRLAKLTTASGMTITVEQNHALLELHLDALTHVGTLRFIANQGLLDLSANALVEAGALEISSHQVLDRASFPVLARLTQGFILLDFVPVLYIRSNLDLSLLELPSLTFAANTTNGDIREIIIRENPDLDPCLVETLFCRIETAPGDAVRFIRGLNGTVGTGNGGYCPQDQQTCPDPLIQDDDPNGPDRCVWHPICKPDGPAP